MRIARGFTPITLDFDKVDLQLLVDAINFSPEDTPLQRQLFDSSVITQGSKSKWVVNDGKDKGMLVERPTVLTLNLRSQENFDIVLDSFKRLAGGLGPRMGSGGRRIQADALKATDPTMVKQHKMLTEAINKMCQINPPASSLHCQE